LLVLCADRAERKDTGEVDGQELAAGTHGCPGRAWLVSALYFAVYGTGPKQARTNIPITNSPISIASSLTTGLVVCWVMARDHTTYGTIRYVR
jgi:hypothetical protein